MNKIILFFTVICLSLSLSHVQAASLVEPDFDGHSPKVTTKWYEYYGPENYQADQNFITGMRPHHAGALSMSEEYLREPERSSARLQSLARGIIRNQTFEIDMLDRVEELIQAIDFKDQKDWYQVAEQGLAMAQRFMRAPVPPIQNAFEYEDHVSSADVLFAKAMIVHHEGALIMCENYLDNPDRNNGYISRMCLDILRDQAQEIQLMKNIIYNYEGNPDDVKIDPSMIHGMDDMMHHMDMSSVKDMSHHGH